MNSHVKFKLTFRFLFYSGLEEVSEETPREIDFAPDEEDVENQLMHIDDQLIRLDGNIEDITDHLDEQLLNTATINAVGESHDALLTQEEENYLFSSMPEVMDPMHSLQLDEQVQDISEIDQMIAAGLPSPLMPSPLLSDEPKTGEPLKPVKQEIKEEIEEVEQEEQQQSSQLYGNYFSKLPIQIVVSTLFRGQSHNLVWTLYTLMIVKLFFL